MSDRVFVCYSREDEDFVLKLAANLKNKGIPIWLDQWDIPSGANWNRTIEKALKECTSLLVVLSPSSVESDEVQSEWLEALDADKVVVPILYKKCKIPFRLKSIQYIDFTSLSADDRESLEYILKDLGMAGSPPITIKTAATPILTESNITKKKFIGVTNKNRAIIAISVSFMVLFLGYFLITYLTPLISDNSENRVMVYNIRSSSSLNVRAEPGCSTIIGKMKIGDSGTVIGGPISKDNHTWLEIEWEDGTKGWSADYYLKPI